MRIPPRPRHALLFAASLLVLAPVTGPAAPASESPPSVAPPSASAPAPRVSPLAIDAALARAREHIATRDEPAREILGAQFIPPHGRPGPGFWLIDLAPYPADRPSPAEPFTSLLIAMDGTVEERGGRRPLSADEQKARAEKAANLQRLMREGRKKGSGR